MPGPKPHRFCRDTARRMLDDGATLTEIGRALGVSRPAISKALRGVPSRPRRTPIGTFPHEWCPPALQADYAILRRKVGTGEARRLIKGEMTAKGGA